MALDEDGSIYVWGIGSMIIPNKIEFTMLKVEDIGI